MKKYLTDFFNYNDWANRQLLVAIDQISDKDEAIKLFSHLITSQNKWLNRITRQADDHIHHWFGPVFSMEELEQKWTESCKNWIDMIHSKTETELENAVIFNRASDGKQLKVKLVDVILQLNYHSIHHRAQLNRMIREQGIIPPSTDYILTAIHEI